MNEQNNELTTSITEEHQRQQQLKGCPKTISFKQGVSNNIPVQIRRYNHQQDTRKLKIPINTNITREIQEQLPAKPVGFVK